MVATTEPTKPLAPYVSYKTLRTFLDSLKQGIPSRIDRSLMSNWSGAVQNQLVAALKYLTLIDDQNMPTPTLRQLAYAEGEERKQLLTGVLRSAYPDLFTPDDFLTSATVGHFHEAFQATGAKGDTLRKNESFFLAAAADAGIPVHVRLAKAAAHARASANRPVRSRPAPAIPAIPPLQPYGELPVIPAMRPVSEQRSTGSARTITFGGGGTITLAIAVDLFDLDEEETQFVLDLRRRFRDYEQNVAVKALLASEEEDEEDEDEDYEGEEHSNE